MQAKQLATKQRGVRKGLWVSEDPMKECNIIRAEIDALRYEVRELNESVSGLVEAWKTASGVVRFVKWSAALATALAAITVSAKIGWNFFVHAVKESVQ